MGLLRRCCSLAVLCLGMTVTAWPDELDLSLDVRLAHSSGLYSYLNGGLGELRFDPDHDGLRLGRARLGYTAVLGEQWRIKIDASDWGDQDRNVIDLTEAYVEFRPYPRSGLRTRVRAGAFYPPISLENREAGWQSPYTLSSSAINTWIGEEIRTIGLETDLTWLGTKQGRSSDIGIVAGVFGWNDPAGVSIASHGFALSDRQTALFGRLGRPGANYLAESSLFREIDGRPGYHVGMEWKYQDQLTTRALHYDNRADPAQFDAGIQDYAWHTSFDSVGLRLEPATHWTFIAQGLRGTTLITPPGLYLKWDYRAAFALASWARRAQRLTLRFDTFDVHMPLTASSSVHGHALTAAYMYQASNAWRFALEWLRITSDSDERAQEGLPFGANEASLQVSVRYSFERRLRGP